MFTKIAGNNYAVKGDSNYIVFNSYKGLPIIINNDFFQRLLSNNLNHSDEASIKEQGIDFGVNAEFEKECYHNFVASYIGSYPGPQVLDLMISEICNLRCPMCIHGYARETFSKKNVKLMEWDAIKKWIDFYVQEWSQIINLKILSFHFGVAEPLINKQNLWRAIEYIGEFPTKLPKEIMINTNLTLLDEKTIELFKKYELFVSVGLDGEAESNDLIRVDSRGAGTFNSIIKNIKALRKAEVHVGIAITLTNQNFATVNPESFLKKMKEVGISSVLVDPDVIQGLECEPELLVEKLVAFQKFGDQLDIEIRGDWKAAFENLTSASDEPAAFCSSIMGKNISISPSGKLLFYCYSSKIVSEATNDTMQTFKMFKMAMVDCMEEYWSNVVNKACSGCPIVGFCAGGCHITREQGVGVNYMCKVYQQSTALLLQYFYGKEDC